MSYENSVQCRLLATHCCVCGKALVDSISVQMGIGPDCRQGFNQGIDADTQKACNVLTHEAAVAAQEGNVAKVRKCAEMIRTLGLPVLADKILERFKNAERLAKITIVEKDGMLIVKTPWKQTPGFAAAWRAIPGRRYQYGRNIVPVSSRREVWELIKQFFPDVYGVGPQGAFKVPKHPKPPKEAA